jgi:hypothetical protein
MEIWNFESSIKYVKKNKTKRKRSPKQTSIQLLGRPSKPAQPANGISPAPACWHLGPTTQRDRDKGGRDDGEVTNVYNSPPHVDRPSSCSLGLTRATSPMTLAPEQSSTVARRPGLAKARLG